MTFKTASGRGQPSVSMVMPFITTPFSVARTPVELSPSSSAAAPRTIVLSYYYIEMTSPVSSTFPMAKVRVPGPDGERVLCDRWLLFVAVAFGVIFYLVG